MAVGSDSAPSWEIDEEEASQYREGDKIGAYTITGLLSRGGSAEIYSAIHDRVRRKVAIKVLHPELAAYPDLVRRFFREAATINEIAHPNIVDIFDFVEHDEQRLFYAVMELLYGQDLDQRLREVGVLEPEEAVTIAEQVAAALGAAHAVQIVHRDLKPGNIFLLNHLDGKLHVKLLDFGLAKAFGNRFQVGLTAAGTPIGTPAYMAPEQVLGRDQDERTDIYTVGTTLYDMLTGRPPFGLSSEGHAGQVMMSQVEDPPPPLNERRDVPVPGALEAVVMRCLEKEPENRFQSAEELREALLKSLDAEEPAPPPTSIEPAASSSRRAIPPILWPLFALLALALAAVWLFVSRF